jgi:2,3-dihydroxy-2,3-dihydrophenylpropionate dehydrogenase
LGDNVVTSAGDVRSSQDNVEAVEECVHAFGRLDDLPEKAIDDAFREIFDTNVKGYLLGAKAALPELRKTSGTIVFSASNSSFYTNGAGPLYTASKHAVVGLIKQLAFELAPTRRVNGVAPGGTLTAIGAAPSLRQFCPQVDLETRRKRIESRTPLQIAMSPEDRLGAYVLLASEHSSAMTGTIIQSDGGVGVRG